MSSIAAGTTSTTGLVYTSDTTGNLVLKTNGTTTAVTVDTNQNVGVGVTPSGGGYSGLQTVQVKNYNLTGYANRGYLGSNVYFTSSGGTNYIASDYATQIVQGVNGAIAFNVAPSGTAGNAITFTQAMQINNSGYTTLGTATSFQSPLDVYNQASDTTSGTMLQLRNTRASGNPTTIHLTDTSTYNWSIGASSASQFAIWSGRYPGQAGTQLLTLDNSGNLLLGTTTASAKLTINAANGLYVYGWGAAIGNGMIMSTAVTASTSDVISFNQNATQVGHIQTTNAGTTLYLGTSDKRLKIDNGVSTDTSVIDNTVIHEFTWKQNNVVDRGVFAQEAFLVKPNAIYRGEDTLNEDGSLQKPWSVDYSKYVPDLIVYCQQLKKQVTTLQSQVAALTPKA